MHATQKVNIRNGDRTNLQVHWHNIIKELLPSSSEPTMLVAHKFFNALPIRVLQVIHSSFHHLSNEVCANLHRKPVQPGARFGRHKTEENSPAKDNPQPPSYYRRVLKPRPSNLAHVLGRSSLKFQNLRKRSSLEVSLTFFKITRNFGELLTSGKSLSAVRFLISEGTTHSAIRSGRVRTKF